MLVAEDGHPFYEQLNTVLGEAGFDRFCEAQCEKFYAQKLGRPSVVPGVYFRMLLIGYFEKLDRKRQIAWRALSRAHRSPTSRAARDPTFFRAPSARRKPDRAHRS